MQEGDIEKKEERSLAEHDNAVNMKTTIFAKTVVMTFEKKYCLLYDVAYEWEYDLGNGNYGQAGIEVFPYIVLP